ncbi:histidine phosphatase family protein [Candidatus Micrarchaeota archaeon]|nr:histidine phosphatase family protein [Candidatus Micrarchaeota archaeon]
MKFFLVRHAQTTANASQVILGGKEEGRLSPRGQKQASELARRLAKEKISEIYCSSSNRCRQTAKLVARRHMCKITFLDELREINMGELTGLSFEKAEEKYPRVLRRLFTQPYRKLPGGESLKDVQKRAMPVIKKLAEKPGNPTILVVAHSLVNRVILASLLGLPLNRVRSIKQKNACINLLDVKKDFAQLYTLDNSIHTIK